MANNTEIKVNGWRLETVTSFIYLGSVITYEGPKPEILSRTAQTTAALTRLKPGINKEIKINGQKLEIVTSFKYLGSVVTDEGPKPEILSRIAQTTAALTRLKPVWNDRSISVNSKIRLMRSVVTSIFLNACESWTLTAELQRRIQAMEMR